MEQTAPENNQETLLRSHRLYKYPTHAFYESSYHKDEQATLILQSKTVAYTCFL